MTDAENKIAPYKRLIVMGSLILGIAYTLAGKDLQILGSNTNAIISGVCGAGLLVFLTFYKDEAKPEQATVTMPLPKPPTPPPNRVREVDVSKVIDEAHKVIREHDHVPEAQEQDLFSKFK